MGPRVVYEGTDLQLLLQQVIDEHGPARIHPPERRRTGGVLGFFARDVYVITVDSDAAEPPAPAQSEAEPAAQTGQLGRIGNEEPVPPGANGSLFPLGPPEPSTLHFGPGNGNGARTTLPTTGDTNGSTRNGRSREAAPAAGAQAEGVAEAPTAEEDVAAEAAEEEPEAAEGAAEEEAEAAEGAAEETRAPVAVQLPLIHLDPDEPPDLGATIVDLLRAAGFPERLLPLAPLAPEHSTVEAIFASLPEPAPLPAGAGALVAVVGASGLVRPVASSLALAVGCPRDEVAVASANASDRHARPEYRVRTASQAAAMSPGWRRDRAGVVAVYAPPLGTDQRWTRQVLRALRPSCVWGMASATTKPDDVRRWIAAIGGVDALVVTEASATATPAAILSLGIPVARLDDEPATPARWAAAVAALVTKH